MRMSDWSSDVCSSDLCITDGERQRLVAQGFHFSSAERFQLADCLDDFRFQASEIIGRCRLVRGEIAPFHAFDGADRVYRTTLYLIGEVQHVGCEFGRSEEHTSELQSLMRISPAVFCLEKEQNNTIPHITQIIT